MTATELYDLGRLNDAIEAQLQTVRSNPADQTKRIFLFELFMFAGDLDRARRQLDALLAEKLEEQAAIVGYRRLIESEAKRRNVFEGKEVPKFLIPPPAHVEYRLEAVLHLAKGEHAKAVELLQKAGEEAPAVKGTLNGDPFELLVDCDDLFGPIVEFMAQGDYFWIPLEQVESITLKPPKYSSEILYRSASLETAQSRGEVFLPSLYPGTHARPDDKARLGRLTDWIANEGQPVRGIGVHTHLVDDRDISLLEWSELAIELAPEGPREVEVVDDDPTAAE